ncbi:uncharacterized protein ddias [Notolabrus celidotus]|uniref:uncharacterized protein ddias n=1 Tax=Notolabrus celidotus TaxID=1203425 RepID=UPI00148F789F|nr:uncharacterized protein ddias [Notolabrus celidotus]
MSVRSSLVECVVLFLQDACVFYPYCKGCFSRIQVEHLDPTRCSCSKCGYICLRENVDHRYRLSLRVTRDKCIFGVTVFGTCLNPFFGIHATGLQRLVENTDEPGEESSRSTLLAKAVQDCFIGRHVIFGIKVTEKEPKPWLGRPDGSSSKDTVQLIATQMILPKALSLGGCTVVSYYRSLLQKAAEYELGSAEQRKPSGPLETPLLLLPYHSTASSIDNASLCTSGLLSQSLQRSQYQDCTLTPTPPWQQSLGLVTSSAEQEEGCSTLDSKEEKRFKNKTPNHVQRENPGYHKVVEERRQSSPPPSQCNSVNSPLFAKFSDSSIDKVVGKTPILDTRFSPSSPTRHLTNSFLSDSLAWEDLPFSESLTEFLGEENQKETRHNLEVRSQSKNSSGESCVSQKYTQITDSFSQTLVGIIDTPAPNIVDRHDLSEQVCRAHTVGGLHNFQARTLLPQEDENAHSVSFDNEEEEQLEDDSYNCSADLFSSSPMINMSTNAHTQTVVTSTEASPLLSMPRKQHMSGGGLNVSHTTPYKQNLRSNRCINEDYFILPGTQDFDFIPPSQSTPIVKVSAVTGSRAKKRTSAFGESQTPCPDFCPYKNLHVLDGKKTPKSPSSSCKSKSVSANQLPQCGRESTKENLLCSTTFSRRRLISKGRFWKHKKHLLAQESPRVPRGALNSGSPRTLNDTFDSSCYDVTVCDTEDSNALFVPPTPAAKLPLSVRLRTQSQTENSSSISDWTEEQQEEGVSCKHPVTSSQRGVIQTSNSDSETCEKEMLDGSNCYFPDGENEACDWSRDLFSDSV